MTAPGIPGLAHFLAHAHAVEIEATERHRQFAGQMEVHDNSAVADLVATLAAIEARHAEAILARAGSGGLPSLAPWGFG